MVHILAGTWEEIKTHDAELVGRQMTVLVNDGDERNLTSHDTSLRLAAFDVWVAALRPQEAFLLDDSRAFIYPDDEDRG